LKKHESSPALNESRAPSTGDNNPRKLLAPPFLKIVDDSFKYKTNFKELVEWPEINFAYQPELCPFHKPRKPNIAANLSQQSNKAFALPVRPNDRFTTVLTTPILTTPTLNALMTRNTTAKRKHSTFCEICRTDYDDFEKVSSTAFTLFLVNNC